MLLVQRPLPPSAAQGHPALRRARPLIRSVAERSPGTLGTAARLSEWPCAAQSSLDPLPRGRWRRDPDKRRPAAGRRSNSVVLRADYCRGRAVRWPARMHEDGRPISIAVIIRRDLASVAGHLREELKEFGSFVAVILDRRYRDRRRALDRRLAERRRTDRRRQSVAKELHENGWAVVILDDPRPNA